MQSDTGPAFDQDCDIAHEFESKLLLLSKTLQTVEKRCCCMQTKLVAEQAQSTSSAWRASEAERCMSHMRSQQQGSQEIEQLLRDEVRTLHGLNTLSNGQSVHFLGGQARHASRGREN